MTESEQKVAEMVGFSIGLSRYEFDDPATKRLYDLNGNGLTVATPNEIALWDALVAAQSQNAERSEVVTMRDDCFRETLTLIRNAAHDTPVDCDGRTALTILCDSIAQQGSVGFGTVLPVAMDYPAAWEFVRTTDKQAHEEKCSYRQSSGGILCDCHIINDEYKRRAAPERSQK